MTMERTGGPGPRKEVGDAESSRLHPPHVTENDHGAPLQADSPAPNDVAASPSTAHGHDRVPAHREVSDVDDESAYDRRPGEHKDRAETDMP